MELPERDGDGYLVDSSVWTSEIARTMAQVDDVELDDTKWQQILKALYLSTLLWCHPFASFPNQGINTASYSPFVAP